MSGLPTGTVTFLFTDIEGSTKLAQAQGAAWPALQARHHAILRDAIDAHGGHVFQVIGDAACAAFASAPEALAAAAQSQQALAELPLKVRMGLHTGYATARPDGDYEGYLTLAQVQRVVSIAYGGQTLVSNATAALLAGQLPAGVTLRDMGEHRLKGILNPERLWQVVAPDLPQDFPPLQTLSAIPNNLPIQLTSFVGRERELAELQRLLTTTRLLAEDSPSSAPRLGGAVRPERGRVESVRLLTLTGSGGTGKTRLSLQVAAEVLDHFKDGVWFIELAPLADPTLVPQTVASVLGIRDEPGRSMLATLNEWLRPKQLLLILDNCEHLIEACAQLADAVLHAGPGIQIMASSREPLGINGETTYRVPSLECPSAEQASRETVEQLTQYAAVQLFIERAAQSQTSFTVTNSNAPAVAQICYRLDGIPLAIELAAARVKALPVEKIAERLDDRFRLLVSGSRTALPRQQTLRALIDWSYNLLSEPEQLLLQRLSVFAGGWTVEAAEGVCAGEGIEPQEILDLLIRLQDKSLISMVDRGQRLRYRQLETIRQYAHDKLLASGQADLVRDRHLEWFTQLAEATEPKLRGAERVTTVETFQEDYDNGRAAITWGIERHSEAALRMVGSLYAFWVIGAFGYLHEARTLAERTLAALGVLNDPKMEDPSLAAPKGMRTPARARAEAQTLIVAGGQAFLQGDYPVTQSRLQLADVRARESGDPKTLGDLYIQQGLLQLYQGNHTEARALFEQGVLVARQASDSWSQAFYLWLLGDAVAIDDPSGARKHYEESLLLFRQIGDLYWSSCPLLSLGHLASEQGDYAAARALLEESLALRRAVGNKYTLSTCINTLVEVLCRQKDFDNAASLCEEALSLNRAIGNKSGIAWSLRNLAEVANGQNDVLRAEGLLRESLSLYRDLGQKRDSILVIESLARIALAQESPDHAATLWGAADALRTSINAPRAPARQDVYDRNVAAARAQLGDAAFDAAFAAGRALTLEQASALALENQA